MESADAMIQDGMRHLAFSAHLCLRQAKAGRYFALEHPVSAASWDTEVLQMIRSVPRAAEVEFDFCSLGMVSSDDEGEAPVKKRTRIITNCPALVEALRKHQCSGDHRHVQLVHGRAAACQQYPVEFCRTVCRALARQLDVDLKKERSLPRKRAVVNSLSNTRIQQQKFNTWARVELNELKVGSSQVARWSKRAFVNAVATAGIRKGVESTASLSTMDCTPLFDALVKREIRGLAEEAKSSEKQAQRSTSELRLELAENPVSKVLTESEPVSNVLTKFEDVEACIPGTIVFCSQMLLALPIVQSFRIIGKFQECSGPMCSRRSRRRNSTANWRRSRRAGAPTASGSLGIKSTVTN